MILLLSRPLRQEYRAILAGPELVARYPQLEAQRVRVVLERLAYLADVSRSVDQRFHFPRDPKDAKLMELAIAGRATHLVTTDRDLLDLASGHDPVAARFRRRLPGIKIMKPDAFIVYANLS